MAKSFDVLLERTATKRTRDRAARRTRELLADLLLSDVRRLAGKSQRQVAKTLGIKQPSLSKLERQADMQISTLRRIIMALGGELDVVARFPKGLFPKERVKIKPFGTTRRRGGRERQSDALRAVT